MKSQVPVKHLCLKSVSFSEEEMERYLVYVIWKFLRCVKCAHEYHLNICKTNYFELVPVKMNIEPQKGSELFQSKVLYHSGFLTSFATQSFLEVKLPQKLEKPISNMAFANIGVSRLRWYLLALVTVAQLPALCTLNSLFFLYTFIELDLNITDRQSSIIFFWCTMGSFWMPIITGYLMDKYGCRKSFVYSSLVSLLASIVIAIGGATASFPVICLGYFINSLAFDTLNLVCFKMVCKWFRNKNLGVALSITTTVASGFAVVIGVCYVWLYNISGYSLGFAFSLSVIICLLSLGACLFACHLDKYREDEINQFLNTTQMKEQMDENYFKKFGLVYWLFILPFVFAQAFLTPLSLIGVDYLKVRYKFSEYIADSLAQFQGIGTALVSPVLGWLIDKYGKIGEQLILATVLGTVACVLQAVLPDCNQCVLPIIPILIQGVFQVASNLAIQVGIARLVDNKMLGMAMGIAIWMMETVQALIPIMNSKIIYSTKSYKGGYYWVFLVDALGIAIGMLFALLAVKIDRITDNQLGIRAHETNEDIYQTISEARGEEYVKKLKSSPLGLRFEN